MGIFPCVVQYVLAAYHFTQGFPHSSIGKESAYNEDTQVRFLGGEDPLEKEMATHPSILAWRIPWTEKAGGLQSLVLQKSDRTERLTLLSF